MIPKCLLAAIAVWFGLAVLNGVYFPGEKSLLDFVIASAPVAFGYAWGWFSGANDMNDFHYRQHQQEIERDRKRRTP